MYSGINDIGISNSEAVKAIANMLMMREVISFDEFKRVAGLLAAFDQFGIHHNRIPLADNYVKDEQRKARGNLTTKSLLEVIINGETDLSPLMEVETVHFRGNSLGKNRYRWQTHDLEHRGILNELHSLGNSMYSDISEAFMASTQYKQMRDMAQECYAKSSGKFRLWQNMVDMNPSEIAATTPMGFAQEIYTIAEQNPTKDNVLLGVRALRLLDKKYPDQGIGELIVDYASHFIQSPVTGRRTMDLKNALKVLVPSYQ